MPSKWGFSIEVPSHGTTASRTLSLPMGRVAFLQSSSGRGGAAPAVCPPAAVSVPWPSGNHCEIQSPHLPKLGQVATAGAADPIRQEALEAKEISPPTSTQHRAPPNTAFLSLHWKTFFTLCQDVPSSFLSAGSPWLLALEGGCGWIPLQPRDNPEAWDRGSCSGEMGVEEARRAVD